MNNKLPHIQYKIFIKRFIILFILFFSIFSFHRLMGLNPQKKLSQFGISFYSKDEGLPMNGAKTVIYGKDGYLWIGTYSGLVRFDGIRMTVYNVINTPVFRNHGIFYLYEDNDTCLWLGTLDGLLSYKNNKWKLFTEKQGLPSTGIESIFKDRNGKLWIGTTHGLCYLYNKSISVQAVPTLLRNVKIKSIAEDNDGIIWIATAEKGLFYLENNIAKHVRLNENAEVHDIRFVLCDNDGSMWAATNSGLYHLTRNKIIECFTEKNGLPSDDIYCLYKDRAGALWIGTRNGGLSKYYSGNFSSLVTTSKFNKHYVTGITEDNEGNIWVSEYNFGIYCLKETKFSSFSAENGFPADVVYCVIEYGDSSLLIGTKDGIIRYRNEQFSSFDCGITLPSPVVRDLLLDSEKNLWICTNNGLVCKNEKGVRIFTETDGLSSNLVRIAYEDNYKSLWFGTENGLNRMKDGEFEPFYRKEGLSDNFILSVFSDSNGNLWVGTREGLNKMKNGVIHSYYTSEGLCSNTIFKGYDDKSGRIWIGCTSGITVYKDEKFNCLGRIPGAPFNNAFEIIEDNSGFLWITSTDGIYRILKDDIIKIADGNQVRLTSFLYTKADGVTGDQCVANSKSCMTSDGKLWFPTINGLAMINPSEIEYSQTLPSNKIEMLKIDSIIVFPEGVITLSPGIRRLELYYTGISFTAPEKVLFKYKLEGFDANWIEAGTKREAVYTNLPPGKFIFKVISCNNDGQWNNIPATITIIQNPHFYQTVYFYVLTSIAFIAIVIFIYYIRVRRIKKYNRELEKQVRLRTAEIQAQKEKISVQAEKLAEANKELEKLSIVASETDNSVIIASADGNLEWVNQGFTKIFGYTFEEFIQQVGKNIIATSSNPNIREAIKECIGEKSSVVYESENISKSGKKVWLQTTLNTILGFDGNIKKIIAIDTDITKLKEAEAEILKQHHEILERNEEIEQQKEEIQSQAEQLEISNRSLVRRNKQIMDSIVYAERIQKAIIPESEFISRFLPEHFILFKPRDIVSGDFYWIKNIKDKLFLAIADCTGHGVPGAFMSIIGNNLLEQITSSRRNIESAANILDRMKEMLEKKLLSYSKETEIDDGLEIALCIIDKEKRILEFAGAIQPLIMVRDNKLFEFKGDNISIGKSLIKKEIHFSNQQIELRHGDTFYMFSDGYMDQFGGEKGQKYYYTNFRKLLLEINSNDIKQQKEILDDTIRRWMYGESQLDDILVFGFKV
ncbi:MAG: SpoIIE family protein phosphatase [Bacteroidia bacterium]|nr:SpoIIE family protein phosphatase [Bacteroidia bacterium]